MVANLKRMADNREHERHAARRHAESAGSARRHQDRSKAGRFTPGLYELIVGERTRGSLRPAVGKSIKLQRKDLDRSSASSNRLAAPSRAKSGATPT